MGGKEEWEKAGWVQDEKGNWQRSTSGSHTTNNRPSESISSSVNPLPGEPRSSMWNDYNHWRGCGCEPETEKEWREWAIKNGYTDDGFNSNDRYAETKKRIRK